MVNKEAQELNRDDNELMSAANNPPTTKPRNPIGSKVDTIVGPVDFSAGPVPNVAKTPLVGGQWGPGTDFPYEMVVVSNSLAPNIPTTGTLRPIP